MKSASYEKGNKSARRGAQFVPIGMPTVCCKIRSLSITHMLSFKYSNMLKISVSENFLVESEWCSMQNKICLFLGQGSCIYVGISFL
jgi:hypothetical protein